MLYKAHVLEAKLLIIHSEPQAKNGGNVKG